ncbi:PAS domain S-box protein, partial [Streptomyces caniscabiei]|uniref:PAS domain S-box protein n=2 Tax=Streptomyces caniscabiei TaxID=2746961 RepID=UPI00211B280C
MGTDRDSAVSRQRFDVADAAPLLIDADGFVTSWTRDAELLFGYPAAEILGRSVRTLLVEGDGERIGALAETHRALGGWSGILTARHRDGHPLKVMVRVVPTREAPPVAPGEPGSGAAGEGGRVPVREGHGRPAAGDTGGPPKPAPPRTAPPRTTPPQTAPPRAASPAAQGTPQPPV